MEDFTKIIGHEKIIEFFQNAISMDKVSHAYILNGPDSSGKMMLARAFAKTLQCERGRVRHVMSVIPVNRQIV